MVAIVEKTHPAERYAHEVCDGIIPAAKPTRDACARYFRDVKEAKDLGIFFHRDSAQWVIEFTRKLKHSKGERWAGTYFDPEPWQQFINWNLFGWHMRETGLRRFITSYVEVPRKNGKSFDAASKAVTFLFAGDKGAPEIYTAATKQKQAKITHGEAVNMIMAEPSLKKLVRYVASQNLLTVPKTGAELYPLSSEKNRDGYNPAMCVIDEYHAHPTSEVYDDLMGGMGAREEPLAYIITTAGVSGSPCEQMSEQTKKVLAGEAQQLRHFGFITTVDDPKDWRDESEWIKANPNWGVSLKPSFMRATYEEAIANPSKLLYFKNKHLNIWTGNSTKGVDIEQWKATGTGAQYGAGDRCYLGVDLSSRVDLTAVALVFPKDDGTFHLVVKHFSPSLRRAQEYEQDRALINAWMETGDIEACPGVTVSFDQVMRYIVQCIQRYQVVEIGYDPWQAAEMAQSLTRAGKQPVEVRNIPSHLCYATKRFGELVVEGRLIHDDDPVMDWQIKNYLVKDVPGNNILPTKNGQHKNDGIMASLIALSRATAKDQTGPSRYESEGLISV